MVLLSLNKSLMTGKQKWCSPIFACTRITNYENFYPTSAKYLKFVSNVKMQNKIILARNLRN